MTASNRVNILPLLFFFGLTACSASAHERAEANQKGALELVHGEIESAVTNGQRAQSTELRSEPHLVVARFNPGRCECPSFEVLLRGVWTRVGLEWVEDADNSAGRVDAFEARAAADAEVQAHPLYILTARLSSDRWVGTNDVEYPILVVSKEDDVGARSVSSALRMTRRGLPEVHIKDDRGPTAPVMAPTSPPAE